MREIIIPQPKSNLFSRTVGEYLLNSSDSRIDQVMSNTHSIFVPATQEFVTLCKSQVSLLTQGLGASWGVVYLTQELVEDAQTKLIPVVAYPDAATTEQDEGRFPQALPLSPPQTRLLADSISLNKDSQTELFWQQRQVVLPLMYDELVMGVLVAGREDRQWNERELGQLKEVAKTLTIACILDQRQTWFQRKLQQQRDLEQQQLDHFDDVLHQVRNPLTALHTFGKLLLKRFLPEDKNYRIAGSIVRESDRVQELLQQLESDFGLFDLDSQTLTLETTSTALPPSRPFLLPGNSLNLEPLVIAEILDPLISSAQAIAQEKAITIRTNLPGSSLPTIQGDARAIREVLNNLIDNAIKYSPEGGEIALEVGLQREEGERVFQGIAIADNGFGIPVRDQDKIFTRHYRGVQSEGEISGSGLGLAIAQKLTEQMQGEIELISPTLPTGKGTTFIVWLPQT